jgi:hypothetical protein
MLHYMVQSGCMISTQNVRRVGVLWSWVFMTRGARKEAQKKGLMS